MNLVNFKSSLEFFKQLEHMLPRLYQDQDCFLDQKKKKNSQKQCDLKWFSDLKI